MSFFNHVPIIPSDPIFGLNTAFFNDTKSQKVNLGVGSFKDSNLKPFILPSVKKAEEIIFHEQNHKEYLPLDGDRDFIRLVQEFFFSNSKTLYGAQAIGGTGALKVGAEFLRKYVSKKIYIPDPTWDNHRRLFLKSELSVAGYSYYDRFKKSYNHEKCCEDVRKMNFGSIVLFHAACHNPTGCDPSFDEWKELSGLIKERNLIPFFDAAYLGFGGPVEEDCKPLKYFVQNHDCLFALSFSKSFGLYSERVGALFINSLNSERLNAISSSVKVIIRSQYSNPPCHGAFIVKEILQNELLKKTWLEDLENMRVRIGKMRSLFYKKLSQHQNLQDNNFDFLLKQKGLFSFTGLHAKQVEQLAKKNGIYLPKNGRVNVAGLNEKNLDYVVESIIEVL